MSWHSFTRTEDDDNECTDCGVVADDKALHLITVPCPAKLCEDPSNDGEPCVFVPSEDGPTCAYCERPGDPSGEGEEPGEDAYLVYVDDPEEELSDEA